MVGGIYLIKGEDVLVEMNEQQYDSEAILQGLLDKYPLLLAGDQIDNDEPRLWLPIAREKGVPDSKDGSQRWFLDHLFLDQDGIPTLVEVKRSSDTRIRREVVGQMLDYAANAVVYWPAESIRSQFEERCTDREIDTEQELKERLNCDESEQFWQNVRTNLEAGKLRMLFVADEIPPELQRIVEFLNEQMQAAEVLAIEIKQYVGEGHKTLVPRLIGQTAKAQATKGGVRQKKKWDEQSFFEELEARNTVDDAKIARKIFEWARLHGFSICWGEGARDGSLVLYLSYRDTTYYTVVVWTYGRVEMQFQWMKSKPPFDVESKRLELLARINQIRGIDLPTNGVDRRPSFPLLELQAEDSLNQFLDVLKWIAEEIKQS